MDEYSKVQSHITYSKRDGSSVQKSCGSLLLETTFQEHFPLVIIALCVFFFFGKLSVALVTPSFGDKSTIFTKQEGNDLSTEYGKMSSLRPKLLVVLLRWILNVFLGLQILGNTLGSL